MKKFIRMFVAFWTTLYAGMVVGRWATLYMQIAKSPIGPYLTTQEINQAVFEHERKLIVDHLNKV